VEQSDKALRCYLELQFPRFTNQFHAKASVRFLMNQTKTGFLVKMTGASKHVICPKYDFTVTSVPGKTGTFGHQAFTDPQASGSRFDEQESELCDGLTIGYQEYAGRWALGVGRWALGVGRWALGVGRWALGVGRWALGAWRWALGAWRLALGAWRPEGPRKLSPGFSLGCDFITAPRSEGPVESE
jgi:hypothetical protein